MIRVPRLKVRWRMVGKGMKAGSREGPCRCEEMLRMSGMISWEPKRKSSTQGILWKKKKLTELENNWFYATEVKTMFLILKMGRVFFKPESMYG